MRRIRLAALILCGLQVASDATRPWNRLVTDVVTLGTPHLGAPLERTVHAGAQVLGWFQLADLTVRR